MTERDKIERDLCAEICGYKGEPSCWSIDDEKGETFEACEVCTPAAYYAAQAIRDAVREQRAEWNSLIDHLTTCQIYVQGTEPTHWRRGHKTEARIIRMSQANRGDGKE